LPSASGFSPHAIRSNWSRTNRASAARVSTVFW